MTLAEILSILLGSKPELVPIPLLSKQQPFKRNNH